MSTCLNCSGVFITADAKKFCCRSCSAKFNNRKRIRTAESKARTSESIKRLIQEGQIDPSSRFPSQKGKRWAKEPTEDWLSYKASCRFYTPYDTLEKIEGFELIEKYGWYNPVSNPRGVSRDHMISVKEGWIKNLSHKHISHPANCKIIPMDENRSKSSKSSITYEELLKRIEVWS